MVYILQTFIQFCQISIQPFAVMFAGRLGKIELDTVSLSNSVCFYGLFLFIGFNISFSI